MKEKAGRGHKLGVKASQVGTAVSADLPFVPYVAQPTLGQMSQDAHSTFPLISDSKKDRA